MVAVLVCLSVIVAGTTAWSLHMTGESKSTQTYCELEEHQHTEECIEKTLICGFEEAEDTPAEAEHQHEPECYDEDGNLICEIPEHTHSEEDGCHTTASVLVCGLDESTAEDNSCYSGETAANHVHTDECYEIIYKCGYDYEHQHTLSCYSNPEADLETEADWEKTIANVELTGDFARDLVAVAKTQLGYTESTENYQVITDSDGNERTKGYTRYGAWYGDSYGDWCAMFVSFCLRYAGVPEEAFPIGASCSIWVETLSGEEWDLYLPSGMGYVPNPGDIIFFDLDHDSSADHVGIVSAVTLDDEGLPVCIETIEGNFGDTVCRRSYEADSADILGYGLVSIFNMEPIMMAEGSGSGHPALSYSDDRESYRAYMEYALPGTDYSTTYDILRQTVLYVYAQAGETICLGSDIYNSIIDENDVMQSSATGVDIVLIGPNGTKHTFDNELNGKGFIGTQKQEAAGANFTGSGNTAGYTPHEFTAPMTGTYEVRFHSYSGNANVRVSEGAWHQIDSTQDYSWNPRSRQCEEWWDNSPVTIGAYDVTVVKNGAVQTGRTYAKYLALNVGANNVMYHANKYVVTEDGYIYNVDAKLDPWGFLFFGNNRGIIDNEDGLSAYHSYKGESNGATLESLDISVQNPANPDTTIDKTYRVFFEEPSPYLCGQALAPEQITEVEFIGAKEDNITYVGNGGYFKFDVAVASSVTIIINFDAYNSAHSTEYKNVTLNSYASEGTNYIYWDGDDADGFTLPSAYYSQAYVNVTVETHAGEFHFAFLDVENSEYVTIHRINRIYDYVNGVLTDVTEDYANSEYTICYDNSVTPENKDKYIKDPYATSIANGVNAKDGVNSSNTTDPAIALKYFYGAGDFAFLDIWTYTLNTSKADVSMDIVIQEIDGYDLVTIKGLVFFDRDNNSSYNIGGGDFPLADVEAALDYYYCGTRWSEIERDADNVTKLKPAAKTHSVSEIINGIPTTVEVLDYYYHDYEVRRGSDGKYYLYQYAASDPKHEGEPSPVLNANETQVEVNIEEYTYNHDNALITDYKVWIPVHKTTKTGNTGEYIFSGVLVNQNIKIDTINEAQYNNIVVTVTNPDSDLYTLTTENAHTGDFGDDDKGTEVQTILLSNIEAKIADARALNSNASNFTYEVADVGYWFMLYEPPLNIKKIWGSDDLSNAITQITVELEGFGVNDGNSYYHCELTFDARDNWKITPTVIPAVVKMVDGAEQALSYRVTREQFTKDGTLYRITRNYSTDTYSYKKAQTDGEGNIVIDSEGNITWIDLGETPHPYETFILDLQHTIIGDIIYVENWVSGSASLTLEKRSAADNTLLLPGATFELLKQNGDKYESIPTGYGGSYMITTDEHGMAEFHGLTEGNYQLREVVAPADYRKVDPILFTVGSDGNIGDNLAIHLESGRITVYDDLGESLASGIAKYDQYDQLIKNPSDHAVFTVYAADSNYTYDPEDPVLALNVTIGDDGKAVFKDGDRQLYISELENILHSKYFVLVETHIPAGYRAVGEAHLHIIGSGMSTYVECENPFESGVCTGQKVMVYAPDTLQIADPDDYSKISSDLYVDENGVIQFASYNSGTGKITGTGTLFAVVLKRCGAEADVTNLTSLTFTGWKPVYGDDIGGYTVMSDGSVTGIIEAAKASQAAYSEAVFTPNAAGVAMNAILTNLPGESTRYFTYMYDNSILGTATEPQYAVAYYYSTANTLDEATEANTVRVTSHGLAGEADDFRLYWATEVEIPDIVNALFVQKTDIYENAVDNAVFALYDAVADSSGNGYYVGTDADGNTVYIRLSEDDELTAEVYNESFVKLSDDETYYIVNTEGFAENLKTLETDETGILKKNNAYLTEMFTDLKDTAGVITVTAGGQTYIIPPATNANDVSCMTVTHDGCTLVDEDGSGHLRYLKEGKYYLKEIYVPGGYDLNYANVEVAVTTQGVYANAGTDSDGVRVGNGAGYLVSTMNGFASIGEIDETLSYIIGKQKLNDDTEFFTTLPSSWTINTDSNTWLYLKYAGSANSEHTSDEDLVLFDYYNRIENITILRLWTERGWSDMAISQDYTYGIGLTSTGSTTKYTNLSNKDISPLFSGSTFVRFKDESVLDLVVTKIDSLDESTKLSGASFVLYYKDSSNNNHYYKRSEGITSWVALTSGQSERNYLLTTGTDGKIKIQSLTNGTYYLKEINSPDGYNPLTYEVVIYVKDGVITVARSDGVLISDSSKLKLSTPQYDVDERYVYNLNVPNNGGYQLPKTGGAGTTLFTWGGWLIVVIALVFGCVLRRKSKRRCE